MGRRQPELGVRRGPIIRRSGQLGFPGWAGMQLNTDPGGVAPNRLRYAENVRFRGGNVDSRLGVVPFNAVSLGASACVSLFDFQSVRPHKLLIFAHGCSYGAVLSGYSLLFFDQDQFTPLSYVIFFPSAGNAPIPTAYGGGLYTAFDTEFRKVQLLTTPYGVEPIQQGGVVLDIAVTTFPGFKAVSMTQFDGKIFVGLESLTLPNTASKIITYDGLTVRDDLTLIPSPIIMEPFRNLLVVGFKAAFNSIQYRTTGSSPGTWTAVAPGAGTLESYQMKSFQDNLYITTGPTAADGNIWQWTGPGGALAVFHTIAGRQTKGLEVFNGFLYFSSEVIATVHAIVGKYDGTAWTDTERDFTVDNPNYSVVDKLKAYKQTLFAGVNLGNLAFLLGSNGVTTNVAWTPFNDFNGTLQPIVQMGVL